MDRISDPEHRNLSPAGSSNPKPRIRAPLLGEPRTPNPEPGQLSDCYRRPLVGAMPQLQALLKLVPELLDDADRRQRGRVTQRAKRLAQDVIRDIQQRVGIFRQPTLVVKSIEQSSLPVGPFAAGNAPPAGLVGVEVRDAPRYL